MARGVKKKIKNGIGKQGGRTGQGKNEPCLETRGEGKGWETLIQLGGVGCTSYRGSRGDSDEGRPGDGMWVFPQGGTISVSQEKRREPSKKKGLEGRHPVVRKKGSKKLSL